MRAILCFCDFGVANAVKQLLVDDGLRAYPKTPACFKAM